MGIRFSCHGCAKPLNIKSDLAGRRGVCPECRIKFRIPLRDAEFSTPLEDSSQSGAAVALQGAREVVMAGAGAEFDSATGLGVEESSHSPQENASVGVQADSRIKKQAENRVSTASSPLESEVGKRGDGGSGAKFQVDAAQPSASLEAEILNGDASSTWYVRPPSGGQYGPATVRVLKSWIGEGRVAKNALLWREGWPQWREAADALPELLAYLPGGATTDVESAFTEPATATSSVGTDATPFIQSSPQQATLDGNAKIGAVRRKRSARRITLVAVLAALVVGLIVTLVLVASSGS